MFEAMEANIVGYIQSGFLDYATGDWLVILADQVYGVTVPDATYATTDVTITNPGGGLYADIEAGDLTFKNTTTGVTYTNTTGGTLASGPGTTLTVTVVADEAGSDGSASAGEIDDMITPLGSSTCTNDLAAVGVDAQSEEATRQQCRDRLGRLSPNGPKDAYSDVARDSDLTGTSNITRVRTYGDSDVGNVTVYLAGPSGAISETDRALVEDAILTWRRRISRPRSSYSSRPVPSAATSLPLPRQASFTGPSFRRRSKRCSRKPSTCPCRCPLAIPT